MKKSPFIEGFREPTLSKNAFFLISDVRGDGEGKLVVWSNQQNQLIVYKGSNREFQKSSKIKNVSSIIQFYDQEGSTQPSIALCGENAFYIFRGLTQSFRLRIPDIIAQVQQQIVWTQYQQNLQQLSSELRNIKPSMLSQKAKYFLSSNSEQRKKQIIQQVFQEGISQKDSISAVSVIKQSDSISLGNVVLGTELNRLYILDNYGHKIINERIIQFAPSMIFAFGNYQKKYVIICVSRQGIISMYLNADKNQASQTIRLNTRINCGDLSYPDFVISTADNVISVFVFSNSNFKISVPKYSIKLNQKILKVLFMKKKNFKLLLVAFQNQFRIFREKEVIFRFQTDFKLYSILYGSFAREESCVILLYQNNGFEVLIGHRLFNPKQVYETRKPQQLKQKQQKSLQIPKKTSQFLKYWNSEPENLNSFKLFERNMKLLKWRTLRGKLTQKSVPTISKIEINPKILGFGPDFIVKLQLQNISNQPIFDIKILVISEPSTIQIVKSPDSIRMLAPFTPTLKQLQITSVSLKPERFRIDLSWKDNICSTIVCVPGCSQMQN